jgi:hypothetical protein
VRRSRSGRCDIDQRYAEIWLLLPPEMSWRVRDDNLERRSNLSFEKMSAPRRAIGQTQNHMHVETRLSVVADSDIADRAQHLALLRDLDLPVGLLLEIEPANGRSFEGARDAAVIPASLANFVSVVNASSPDSRIATRASEAASPDNLALFIVVRPRCAGRVDLP